MAIGIVAHIILAKTTMSRTQHGPMTSPTVHSHGTRNRPGKSHRRTRHQLGPLQRYVVVPHLQSHQTRRDTSLVTSSPKNAHGLRHWARDEHGNPRPNSPLDYTRYEHLITTMKLKGIETYFVQETWLEGDVFDKIINRFHVFRHNGEVGNHSFCGVAIILSPHYHEGWKAAGARPPVTTDGKGEFVGRFISLNIKLASNDRLGKKYKVNMECGPPLESGESVCIQLLPALGSLPGPD